MDKWWKALDAEAMGGTNHDKWSTRDTGGATSRTGASCRTIQTAAILSAMNRPFDTFVDDLVTAMGRDFVAVDPERNPVAAKLETGTKSWIGHVIDQYTLFPRAIVSMLYAARDGARNNGWRDLDVELTRNMGEELGTETKGVPHAEMLVRGVESALGRKSVRATKPNPSTARFLDAMARTFGSDEDVVRLAGATYALEASAVPELRIVWRVVNRYIELDGQTREGHEELVWFFDSHLEVWEPGHEAGIRDAGRRHFGHDGGERAKFEASFRDVLKHMDDWWIGLASEAA